MRTSGVRLRKSPAELDELLQPYGGGGVNPEWVRLTTQSVTCQPRSPCRSVRWTVSSTALMNDNGIDPSSTSSRNRTPEPTAAGSTRSPTVARNGLSPAPMNSAADPVPTGRSTQMVVVSRKDTSSPKSLASVAAMTSFCTSPYSDTWV